MRWTILWRQSPKRPGALRPDNSCKEILNIRGIRQTSPTSPTSLTRPTKYKTNIQGSTMKKFLLLSIIFFTTAVNSTASENLLKSGDAEDPELVEKWGGTVKRVTDDTHTGNAAIQIYQIGCAKPAELIRIDKTKTYELSAWIKSKDPDQLCRMLMDIRFFTADKKPIKPMSIRPFSSVSELADDVAKGDMKLRVKKKEWPSKMKLVGIVFNAEEDQSDIPNMEYLSIRELEDKGDFYELTLGKPAVKPFPKGTKVRLHKYLDYPRVWDNHVPNEWKKYSFKISAKVPPGARPQMKFWKGAEYMSAFFINHYNKWPAKLPDGEKMPVLLIDDVTIREVTSRDRNSD